MEINCSGSEIYNGNFKLWFCGVWWYHRRDTDGAFVLQDQKACSFFKYADVILPSVALAQGFGRIGCFLAGCCYGKETESIFSVIFQNSEYAPNHVALIPTQLYSSGLDFLHFFLLLLIARNKKEDGQVTACYLIFYSIGRFVIEFFRGDIIRGSVGILSTSQFISIFTGIAGIVLLTLIRKKNETARAAFKRIREVPCIRKKLDNSGIRTSFRCIHL